MHQITSQPMKHTTRKRKQLSQSIKKTVNISENTRTDFNKATNTSHQTCTTVYPVVLRPNVGNGLLIFGVS